MMRDIYVLTQPEDDPYGREELICWYETLEEAEAQASKLEWERYHEAVADTLRPVAQVYSPEETSYRHYCVRTIPKG